MGKWDKYAVEETAVKEGGNKWDKYAVEETVAETPVQETPAETAIPTVTMDANDGLVPASAGEFDIKNPTRANGVINIPKGGVTSVALQVEHDKLAQNQSEYVKNAKNEIRKLAINTDFSAPPVDPMEGQQQQSIDGNLPGNAVDAKVTDFERNLNYIINPENLPENQIQLSKEDKDDLAIFAQKAAQVAPAIQKYSKELEQKPDDVETLNKLAENLAFAGDTSGALSHFTKANSIQENGASLMGLGNVYLEAGDNENARNAFEDAYYKDKNPDALIKAAYAESALGNTASSLEMIDNIKEEFPNYSYGYALSAYNNEKLGDKSAAAVDNATYEILRQQELLPEALNATDPNSDYAKERASQYARLGAIHDAIAAPINFFGEMQMGTIKGGIEGLERIGKGMEAMLMQNNKVGAFLDILLGSAETFFSGAMLGVIPGPTGGVKAIGTNVAFHSLPEPVNKVLMEPLNILLNLTDEEVKEFSNNEAGMLALGNTLGSILFLGAVHGKNGALSKKEQEAIIHIIKGESIEGQSSSLKDIVKKAKDYLENSKLSSYQEAATVFRSMPADLPLQDKISVAPDLVARQKLQDEMAKASPAFKGYYAEKIRAIDENINAKLSGNKTESLVKEELPNLLENESVKEEMAYIEEEISSSKESDSKKGVLGRMLSSGNKYLKEKKEELALIKSDPIAYFEKKLKDEQDWAKENPEYAYPNTINRYKTILSELKGSEKKVEPTSKVEAIKKPTFENVPVFTRTPEEIEFAKNEVFNNLSKLEIGSVIENSDGEIKVVTENSIDKKGNQLIGVITYERQADGSLRQMTNIVWAEKKADGKIKLEYSPHLTATNSKGERVTVTDQITDKKIDLSKENIFAEDKDGNLIQVNKVEPKAEVKEVLMPEYSEKLKDVSPETKVTELPDGLSVEFNGEKGTIGRSETGETLFINAEGKETIVGGGGDVATLAEKGISRTEGTYSDKRGDYYVKDGRVFEITKDGLKPVYEGEKANIERKEAIIRKALNPDKPKVVEQKTSNELSVINKKDVIELTEDSPELNTIEHDLKNGDKVTANIFGKKVEGTVTGVGKYKDQIVIDFKDVDGNERFIYADQIENIESAAPKIENITTAQKNRIKELLSRDELSAENLNELKSLTDIRDGKQNQLDPVISADELQFPAKEQWEIDKDAAKEHDKLFDEDEIRAAYEQRDQDLSQIGRAKDYKEQLIHENFGGITEAQWNRFGDSNWLKGKEGKKFRKKYIKNSAGKADTNDFASFTLDSGDGSSIEITPQDVVDYIIDRESNPQKYDGRLKQWNDAASIPKKDVSSILTGDDAMIAAIVESNRGFGMTDLEADTIKRYVESKAKNEARAKNTKQGSAEGAPKSAGPTAKSERVGRKAAESKKKKDEAKSVKAEENKYAKAEEKITKIFDVLREKAKNNPLFKDYSPEGTKKGGGGMEDLINAAEKVIIGAIRAGEKIDVAISKGLDHLKEKWDDSFGEFPEKELRDILKENGEIQLSHEKTDALREKYGMEEREINDPVSTEKTRAEAQKIIKKGFDVIKLANEVIKKERTITPVERAILAERVAILDKELLEGDTASPEYAKKLEELNTVIKASEISASQAGSSLGSIAHIKVVADESLAGYFQEQRRVNKEGALTEKQTATNKKEFEEITKVKEAYEKRLAKIQEENNRLKAEKEVEKLTKKASKRTAKEKLDEDFDALAKEFAIVSRSTLSSGGPIQATGIILKMVKNRVEKGVITLSEVVDAVHDKVGEFGISKEDIIAAIAGKSGVERTRSEAAKNLYELKQEAKLVTKLTDLQNGKEPSSERGKIQKNIRLEELRKQIKEHDLTKTAEYKKRLDAQIAEVERELATGDFAKEEKAEPLKLDKETLELQDKYMQMKNERDARLLKEEYDQRSDFQKATDIGMSLINAPMTMMSGGEFSAVLRQGLVASIAHPKLAIKAATRMFKFFKSQKDFDRWNFEVKKDPRYLAAKESGLAIVDPHDPKLSAREEAFMGNIVEKIPIYGGAIRLVKIKDGKLVRTEGEYGGMVKASERAYVGFLNKMRWDVYNLLSERLKGQGITPENNPGAYKDLASYVNNSTGRGNVGKGIERLSPALNATFFSPRLWASRLKLLSNWANPWWYKNVPKEVRRFYWEDMGKLIGTMTVVYSLAKLNGASVETDPRSSDFLKIRDGKKRYDNLGGFQQPIRTLAQYASGQKKDIESGEITELTDPDKSLPNRLLEEKRLAVIWQHIRGKFSPVPAAVADFSTGRMMDYSEPTVEKEIMRMIVPLAWQDIYDAYGQEGASSLVTSGIPTVFGVSTSIYKDRPKEEAGEKPDKPDKPKKKKRNRSGFN